MSPLSDEDLLSVFAYCRMASETQTEVLLDSLEEINPALATLANSPARLVTNSTWIHGMEVKLIDDGSDA